MENKNKRKIVIDIILYIISGVLLLTEAIAIAIRFSNNGNLYIFGNRVDVVLTDSMSSKNEKYIDFLEGHDDQIDAFDLVVSKKLEAEDEINVYDIVLFNNPGIGVDMHRVVGKTLIGCNSITAAKSDYRVNDSYEGVCLYDSHSNIITSPISFKEFTFTTYNEESEGLDHFNFSILTERLVPEVVSTKVQNGYLTTYKFKRDNITPGAIVINHKGVYDYTKELVVSCEISLHAGGELITLNKDRIVSEDTSLVGRFNKEYEYEIRGDKANTSDGVFKREDIISKVTNRIPKLGIVVRYLTSVWGIVTVVLLGVIILVFDIMSSRLDKKEKAEKNE